jgi:glycosyltransferase involved in cell wall biosynthesis
MEINKKILLICSEDPRIVHNGVTAALNTCFRVAIEMFYSVDIYIDNKKSIIMSNNNEEIPIDFKTLDLSKYDLFFLSPINIIYKYIFFDHRIRSGNVYSFLSDVHTYVLIRGFILGLKFNKIHFRYLLKIPFVFFLEKYVDVYSKKVLLQTNKDSNLYNRLFFSNKGTTFPNCPKLPDTNLNIEINSRQKIGWITSFTEDYFYLTKWVFHNIITPVLLNDKKIVLHIHGKNYYKLEELIDFNYSEFKSRIIFTDFIDNISDLYNDCRIVISAIYKDYGVINRTIEAMYSGCVVVGDPASFNGMKNAKDGFNCFIAKNRNEFIHKIQNAFYSDQLSSISRNAVSTIKQDFNINNNILRLSETLNEF